MRERWKLAAFTMGICLAFSAHATEYDFSVGYTNGPLVGQHGWGGDTNYIVNGELELNPTNEWFASMQENGLDAVSNNQFTVSARVSFEEISQNGGDEFIRVMLNDAPSGETPSCSLILSRVTGNDNYGLDVRTDKNVSLAWTQFPADSMGFDDDNLSDELILSLTLFKGDSADDWGYSATISNVTDGVNCLTKSQLSGVEVTTNTANAAVLYGGVSSSKNEAGIANRLVQSIDISSQYVEPPDFDLVFDIDFQDHPIQIWYEAYGASALNAWNWAHCVTNPTAANTGNKYIEHRPGYSRPGGVQTIDGGWKGQIFTTPYRPIKVGETLEYSFDYTQYTRTNGGVLDSLRQLDVFFTTNGIHGENVIPSSEQFFGQNADSNHHLGFMLRLENDTVEDTCPDGIFSIYMDPANLNPDWVDPIYKTGFIDLNDIGLSNVASASGDHDGDLLRITYTATKTTTSNVWDCAVSISNTVTGSTWIMQKASYTNAAAYNAQDLYLGMYTYSNTTEGEGWEMDNLVSKIHYAPALTGWDGFVDDYSLSGTKTTDEDSDGLNDWGEYVFGGNPTNSADIGIQPVFDASTGEYIFALVGDTNVVAHVATKEDLVIESSWKIIDTVNVEESDGALHSYTFPVGTAESQQFIKLLVE